MKNILLTGGAGYIGSHTCLTLIDAGYNPIIVDNFINSKAGVIKKLSEISKKNILIEVGDVCNYEFMSDIIKNHNIYGVIHFAALKSVEDSLINPLEYFRNNVGGLISVLNAMKKNNCKKLIFSSSACVYGDNNNSPIKENSIRDYVNPYGQTKIMCEDIINTYSKNSPLEYVILRYFNPIGCHISGKIGEDPNGKISNLMPNISNVALGIDPYVKIYGDDYNTIDGTGVRDFIHIMDLAEGHISALQALEKDKINDSINLGTGKGISVIELIEIFRKVSKKEIKSKIFPRRLGDVASIYADVSLAKIKLNWKSKRDVLDMCNSSWAWINK